MTTVETMFYVVIFGAVGFLFIFGALWLGRFLRPYRPTPVKQATYECGEIPVGPSDLQFDLRFYVVALVFLVFEVELAFFFPWATVFGTLVREQRGLDGEAGGWRSGQAGKAVWETSFPAAVARGTKSGGGAESLLPQQLSPGMQEPVEPRRRFLWLAVSEVGLFLAIVLLGFFYLWHQGDLDWVRSLEAMPVKQPILSVRPSSPPFSSGIGGKEEPSGFQRTFSSAN